MYRKGLSLLLVIILMLGILSIIPVPVNAQKTEIADEGADSDIAETGYYDYSTFNSRLDSCKGDYPNGSYSNWQAPSGWSECWAYANQITYRLFGSYGYTWDYHQDRNSIYPGDLIRYGGYYGTGHSIVVTAVDGDTIYYTDRNGTSNYNMVRWGASINRWDIYFISGDKGRQGIYHASNWDSVIPWVNPVPDNAWLNIDRSEIVTGESIRFNFGADNANGLYTIGIDKGNNRIVTENIRSTTYSYTFNQAGDYSAYVTCYGDGGLADTNRVYFKVYENIPASNAWIKINKNTIEQGESITFTYGADHSNGYYTIGIDKGNKRIHTKDIRTNSYTYTFNEEGEYSAYVTCYGYGGLADTKRVYFTVTKPFAASNAWIKINKDAIEKGQSITFTYGAEHSNGYFTIGIDKGDKRIHTKDIQTNSYTYTFSEAGDYSAYVTCYGNAGLADTERVYFKVYDKFPALNAWIRTDNDRIEKGQSITFTYGAEHSNGYFTIGIDKDNKRIHTKDIQTSFYQYTFNEVGNYSAYVTCYGDGGLADTERVSVTVYENLLGDVDGDGEATIIDATFIQRYNVKMEIPISEETLKKCGDVDGDGEVSVIDATFIQRFEAKIPTPYPIGEAIT